MSKNKSVILFNPRSADYKFRIPNSILSVASSIHGIYDYVLVDGNRESDPLQTICDYLNKGDFGYFGCTVMPGPQLKQAIPFTKYIRQHYPDIKTIWGGYFPSTQYRTVLKAPYVDVVVSGPGEEIFLKLIDALEAETNLQNVPGIMYHNGQFIINNPKPPIPNPDTLPPLPYETLNRHYPLDGYLGKTILGQRTLAYHSSYGCPFRCSFCAVVPIYNACWKGKSAQYVYDDIKYLKDNYGADSIEFHDNNFFVSEKRVIEFCNLIKNDTMSWWGEGRIDTIDEFSDSTLALMRKAGCRMIFLGAETGNDEVLKKMNKGGKQSGKQIKTFTKRLARFDLIPEYSFVLGSPAETAEQVWQQIEADIRFIKEVKSINPLTEIIIYVYSPVPTEGSELYTEVQKHGFRFPQKLEDWLEPRWENLDLRKNPMTPWLTPAMIDRIMNFETVLNAYYPTLSDIKLTTFQRKSIRFISSARYRMNWFKYPYELRFLQSRWLKYRQPEIEGF